MHLGSFHGAYLSATSTYYAGSSSPRGEYGIFVSKCTGPGSDRPHLRQQHGRLICDTEVFGPCADAPGMHYPRSTTVALRSLLRQRSMPAPCNDVSSCSWC